MTANIALPPERESFDVSLATLITETRESMREFGGLENALEYLMGQYHIEPGETQEILKCEIRAAIRRERQRKEISYSVKALTDYVRVLVDYQVSFEKAIELTFAQYNPDKEDPKRISELVGIIHRQISSRSRLVQEKLENNPAFADKFRTF